MTAPLLTPQQRLFHARRALRAAATLCKDAASLGCIDDESREDLTFNADVWLHDAGFLGVIEKRINEHQSRIRAKRNRRRAA